MTRAGGTVDVLLVDGDAASGDRLAASLTEAHPALRVSTETDPERAVDRLVDDDTAFDCVVSGFDLARRDGLDLLAMLRDNQPHLPLVLSPRDGSDGAADAALDHGTIVYAPRGNRASDVDRLVDCIIGAVEDGAESQCCHRDHELERYELMVNESGDLMFTTDDGGVLTAVNDAAADFLGYRREALVGQPVSTIVTPASIERGGQAIDALLQGDGPEATTVELDFVTADGERVQSEVHLTVLSDGDDGVRGSIGVVRDITARKEREQTFRALHEATHRLVAASTRDEAVDVLVETAREVLDLSLVGVWLYDEEERALLPEEYPEHPALPDEPPVFREGEGLSWTGVRHRGVPVLQRPRNGGGAVQPRHGDRQRTRRAHR